MQDNKILTLLLLSIDIKVSSDSKNEEFNRSSNMMNNLDYVSHNLR